MGIPANGPGSRPAATFASIMPAASRAAGLVDGHEGVDGRVLRGDPLECVIDQLRRGRPSRRAPATPGRPPMPCESPSPDRTGAGTGPQPPLGRAVSTGGSRQQQSVGHVHERPPDPRCPDQPVTAVSGISGTVLDHVAHAVPRWQDIWDRYAVDLGAEWSSGGTASGFAPGQLQFGNGAKLEMLMPHDTAANDFLARSSRPTVRGPTTSHSRFRPSPTPSRRSGPPASSRSAST